MNKIYLHLKDFLLNLKTFPIVLLFIIPLIGSAQEQRIVNGEPTTIQEYPWQVFLGGCGASVISEEWVLTAGHCRPRVGSNLTFGQTFKNQGGTQTRKASKVIIHPSYQSVQNGYDVALIKVDRPIDLTDPKVAKIRIATEKDKADGLTDPGARVVCTGWGKNGANGSSPNQLYKMDVPIVSDVDAKNEIGQFKAETMIATGTDGQNKSACFGDSGGPLAIRSENGNVLVGVVSWGRNCRGISIFARVTTFAKWIFDNTGITDPTGIEDATSGNLSLILAPNPNNGIFHVMAQNLKGNDIEVTGYDLQGKSIYNSKLFVSAGNINQKLDLSHLNKGVYFLNIKAENGNTTSRLVIR